MCSILTIGDLHGRNNWEKFADLRILIDTPNMFTEYDYYVFLGDYTDSFDKTNVEIMHNLNRLARLKANYPDKVILLLGNHDLQYMFSYELHGCSGYRPEAFWDLNDYFKHHQDKFQAAFQLENIIWTHAGIHRGWYDVEFPFHSDKVADDINGAFKQKVQSLFHVGHRRGGFQNQGGPFWADKVETSHKPLNGYHQVIGHTPVDIIKRYDHPKTEDTYLFYCDAVEHGYALELELDGDRLNHKIIQEDPIDKFYKKRNEEV